MFQEVIRTICQYSTIILHRHAKPDGDALGSQTGLKHLILDNFPEKTVYVVGDAPGIYAFMDDSGMDTIADSLYQNALAIILDCGSRHLVSDGRYQLAAGTIRIDHHIPNDSVADLEILDPSFESCCGMITQLAIEAGWRLSSTAAVALYTGMVTDSGRFRYDCTTADTFRRAAFLMSHGIDTNRIFKHLYADTIENKRRKSEFLLKARFVGEHLAYIYTTRQEFTQLNMDPFAISRGMVNVLADIKGVEIWANFTETDAGILCELRSAGPNINLIAVKYGGGGHAKASGATLPNRETVHAMLQDLYNLIGA